MVYMEYFMDTRYQVKISAVDGVLIAYKRFILFPSFSPPPLSPIFRDKQARPAGYTVIT